jgi:cytochrome c peroxidase
VKKLAVMFVLAILSSTVAAQDAGPPTLEEGTKLWNDKKAKCVQCHGVDGKGDTKMGKVKQVADMTTAEWQKRFNDPAILEAVLKGVQRDDAGRKVKMEPLKGATPRDAAALLLVVRSFAPKTP